MRYVEVNKREVYLRQDPHRGLIVRGEMEGCSLACYVDLNQILLEHALSCEGCKNHVIAVKAAKFTQAGGQWQSESWPSHAASQLSTFAETLHAGIRPIVVALVLGFLLLIGDLD